MDAFFKDFTKDFHSLNCHEKTANEQSLWSVAWADLMMVMFVLFVVLFIYASNHVDVRVIFSSQSTDKVDAKASMDPLVGLIGKLNVMADPKKGGETGLTAVGSKVIFRSKGLAVIKEGHRIRTTLRGDMFFSPGKAEIGPVAQSYIAELADTLKASRGIIHVVGYTDPSEANGSKSFDLSVQRANSVANYMINNMKMDPARFVISGRGAYMPEIPNNTDSAKTINRRVEIIILTDA